MFLSLKPQYTHIWNKSPSRWLFSTPKCKHSSVLQCPLINNTCILERNKNIYVHKNSTDPYVHSSFIHQSLKPETTQMPIHRRRDKQMVMQTYNDTEHGKMREQITSTCKGTDKSPRQTDRKIQARGSTYHTIPFIGRWRTGGIYQRSQKVRTANASGEGSL